MIVPISPVPPYTPAEIGKILGVADDGSGGAVLRWVVSGALSPTPALVFSAAENSQYAYLLEDWL